MGYWGSRIWGNVYRMSSAAISLPLKTGQDKCLVDRAMEGDLSVTVLWCLASQLDSVEPVLEG
jgi:hypothetical protein